jgi:hypothetical protein
MLEAEGVKDDDSCWFANQWMDGCCAWGVDGNLHIAFFAGNGCRHVAMCGEPTVGCHCKMQLSDVTCQQCLGKYQLIQMAEE